MSPSLLLSLLMLVARSFYVADCHVAVFVFQVEVKAKKEVSLLDLDDCECG